MPSQPRTFPFYSCFFACLAAVMLSSVMVVEALAAAAASADQSGDYSGNMLVKVTELWAPPPALKSDFKVRVKISVDGKGKVVDCKPVAPSGLEAFDTSVCGAVRQIGTFKAPPYGAPIDVYMTFWSGTPKGKPRPENVSQEEALREEVRTRTKAEASLNDTRAASVEDRARERAEAIAKANGADLPEPLAAQAAPRAVQQPKPTDAAKAKKTGKIPVGQNADSAPATQILGKSGNTSSSADLNTTIKPVKTPALPTYGEPDIQESSPTPQPQSKATPMETSPEPSASGRVVKPQAADQPDSLKKYTRGVSAQLRNAILIPAETEPGEYSTRLQLYVSATGEITDFKVLTPTGDKLLDKYVQRGIRRAGSLPPPPAELGGTLDITLTLVRR